MQGHGILTVEDLNTGSVLKQGDRTLLKFRLKDYDNETLDIKGKSCKVVLLSVDYTGKIDIAETVVEEDGIVRFSIEVDLLPTIYFMEFIVDGKYVFPSKHTHYWTITPSSLGADVNTIETVGVDDLVERVLTQVTDRQIDLSDYATIEFVKKHFEKFELTDEQREQLRGQDGKSITITNTTTDEQGNTLITFSDETIVTIQRGKDGKPITIDSQDKNEQGDTVLKFSDGTSVTLPKGDPFKYEDFTEEQLEALKGQSIQVSSTDTTGSGDLLVNFTDGTSITIPKGDKGDDGKSIDVWHGTADEFESVSKQDGTLYLIKE